MIIHFEKKTLNIVYMQKKPTLLIGNNDFDLIVKTV